MTGMRSNDTRFPKQSRLLRGGQFEKVYRRRRSAGDGMLIVHGCENECGYPRLGLSVGRRAGGAVVRNRWKRQIREAFRRRRHALPTSVDLVVSPRHGAQPDADRIGTSLVHLARRVARQLAQRRP